MNKIHHLAQINIARMRAPLDDPLMAGFVARFVYHSAHAGVMRQRKSWFERFDGPFTALWWVRTGHIPSIAEAVKRLDYLRARGDSLRAFSFARLFPPPGAANPATARAFTDACPAT